MSFVSLLIPSGGSRVYPELVWAELSLIELNVQRLFSATRSRHVMSSASFYHVPIHPFGGQGTTREAAATASTNPLGRPGTANMVP